MSQVTRSESRFIEADPRYLMQGAKLAISDIYDAITELTTNSDDRYQVLETFGRIEIEIARKRGVSMGTLKIRDFADGMTTEAMKKKLSRVGGRVSGLESGKAVRGTNARGAKDVAALGNVTFQSIAVDGKFHQCAISQIFKFTVEQPAEASDEVRNALGISAGTGTVVTIELIDEVQVPRHDTLCDRLADLVPLRDIFSNPQRKVIVIDKNGERTKQIVSHVVLGVERLAKTIRIPGYEFTAKLTIKRAAKPFERAANKFRRGGILIKSQHAVHEVTLFDSALENDIHAQRFFGRLSCPGIDTLWNDYDDRFDKELPFDSANPKPVIDPSRKSGLTHDHPFVIALRGEVLKQLRPLVEEERRQAEAQSVAIENKQTRRRLNELELKASEFLRDHAAEDDATSNSDHSAPSLKLKQKGFSLTPPFAQMVVGDLLHCSFQVAQEHFPEFERGTAVAIECLSASVECDSGICIMETHPTRAGILSARFKISAISPTAATGIRVRSGRLLEETMIEVLATAAERYAHVTSLQFERQRYSGTCGTKRKKVRILAPLSLCNVPTDIQLTTSSSKFAVPSKVTLSPSAELGVAIAELTIKLPEDEAVTLLTATCLGQKPTAELIALRSSGDAITITLENLDYGPSRYRKKNNVIQIATKHPSLKRYLGDFPEFIGQDKPHFRVLVAEIVADAVCTEIVSRNGQLHPENYVNADWDQYYAEWSDLMTRFLPIAHRTQVDP